MRNSFQSSVVSRQLQEDSVAATKTSLTENRKLTNDNSKKGTSMQVNLRHKGSITILDIEGRIIGADALALKTIIDQQIQATDSEAEQGGKLNLILNMERVQMMDSSGLGVLVASYTTIQRSGGNVVLLNLGGNVRSLIVMAKLMTIFDCYDTEAEAIAGIVRT